MKIFFVLLGILYSNIIYAGGLKDSIIPVNNQIGIQDNGTRTINDVLLYVKDFIFVILGVIAIGVFLYFGFKLIVSKGNPEEMQKTLIRFVYAIVGLAVIPLSYAIVKIITTLNI